MESGTFSCDSLLLLVNIKMLFASIVWRQHISFCRSVVKLHVRMHAVTSVSKVCASVSADIKSGSLLKADVSRRSKKLDVGDKVYIQAKRNRYCI